VATSARDLAAVEAYLMAVPEPGRSALQHLRSVIRAEAPDADECITYGMPGFRLKRPLVGYAAFKAHLSFFPMSGTLIAGLAGELEDFRTSKGTIQFTPDKPLPDSLVRRIVAARKAESAG